MKGAGASPTAQARSKPLAKGRVSRAAVSLLTWFNALPPRRSAGVVFAVFAMVYLLTASYGPYHWDTYSASVPAWKVGTSGTLRVDEFFGSTPFFVRTDDGAFSNRFPGVIFVAVPAYWLADLLGMVSSDEVSFVPAAVTAALATAAAMAVLFLVFCTLTNRNTAVLAVATAGFATSTWSVSGHALWTHGPAQLYASFAMLSMAGARYVPAGIACGFAAFTRPQLSVVPFVLGIYQSIRRRSLRPAAFIGVLSAIGLGALLTYNHFVFDTWSVNGGYPPHATDSLTRLSPVDYLGNWFLALLSPVRGVLIYSPFLVVALLGIREAWPTAPDWVRGAALSGAVYLAFQLGINHYAGGDTFFGYRLPLEALTLLAPLLLLASLCWMRRGPERPRVFAVLVVSAALLQAFGAIGYGSVMQRQM